MTPTDQKLLEWKTNTPQLLKEILTNDGTSVLRIPIQIFANQLGQVATRCAEINDPVLNHLMCRLALYEIADPYSKDYNQNKIKEVETDYINFKNNNQ